MQWTGSSFRLWNLWCIFLYFCLESVSKKKIKLWQQNNNLKCSVWRANTIISTTAPVKSVPWWPLASKTRNEFNWYVSNKRVRIKCKKLTSELSWKLWRDLTHICLFHSRLLAATRHLRSKLVWVDALRIHDATILEAFLIYFFIFAIQGVKGGLLFETPRSPHMV